MALEYLDFKGKYINFTETHDFWELCFVKSGNITLISDQNKFSLCEGEMILISPGRQHVYKSVDQSNCEAYVICFDSQSYCLKAIANQTFKTSKIQQSCMEIIISEAGQTFDKNDNEQLQISQNPNFGGQQAILSQLEYLLICTVRLQAGQKNANIVFLNNEDFYSDLTEIILEYFKNNISSKLSLSQICKKINYSRSFLCKTFKEQTGQTLIAYFNNMKIEEAKKLLVQTEHTAAKIAQLLGFGDAKYFNTLFKKQTGMTPASYRRKYEKTKND